MSLIAAYDALLILSLELIKYSQKTLKQADTYLSISALLIPEVDRLRST